uniref:CSON013419 protein n=1 Tax=Culicoides sonorensis TaxID=179676 RepID=A0A336M843_CULSO
MAKYFPSSDHQSSRSDTLSTSSSNSFENVDYNPWEHDSDDDDELVVPQNIEVPSKIDVKAMALEVDEKVKEVIETEHDSEIEDLEEVVRSLSLSWNNSNKIIERKYQNEECVLYNGKVPIFVGSKYFAIKPVKPKSTEDQLETSPLMNHKSNKDTTAQRDESQPPVFDSKMEQVKIVSPTSMSVSNADIKASTKESTKSKVRGKKKFKNFRFFLLCDIIDNEYEW